MKTRLLRLLSAPLLAMSLLLSVFGAPARATTDQQLAEEMALHLEDVLLHQGRRPAAGQAGRRASQSISIIINASRAEVFEAYSNFNNHIERQPGA